MKRAVYFTAVCLFACCVASMAKAEEEHHREGGGRTWFGTFAKSDDGKVTLTSNGESHVVLAGEKAKDDVKTKLADAEKELVGQGTFQVIGTIKKEGDAVIIRANAIIKKGEGAGVAEKKDERHDDRK
jgi:hypothetical protein